MSKINVLVVVYNKCLADSATLSSLLGIEDINVYVADNSTSDFRNGAFAAEAGYRYINMGGNKGLSRAYNAVISMLDKNDDIICLFDDDTIVDSQYFKVLKEEVTKHLDNDVFAPVVNDGVGVLSPCLFDGIRGKRVETIAQLPQYGVSAINSGLAIRTRVFKNYRYDEGQFLDYVDHAFIRDVICNDKTKLQIMNVVIKQRFSGNERPGKEADLKRFEIYKKDITYYCRKYGISAFCRWKLLVIRRLSLFIKYFLG